MAESGPLRARRVEVLQINVGKRCNQTCRHCHVDAGPDRPEVMPREVLEACFRMPGDRVQFHLLRTPTSLMVVELAKDVSAGEAQLIFDVRGMT